jgi:hypothetical protein
MRMWRNAPGVNPLSSKSSVASWCTTRAAAAEGDHATDRDPGRARWGDPAVESPGQARIRNGLEHVPAERLIPAPDRGMKYPSRAGAFGKPQALVEGAAIVRCELA